MKKSVLILVLAVFFFASCGETKKEEVKQEVEATVEAPASEKSNSDDELLALGKELFTSKTCVTCHQPDAKVIGPSIKDINKVYTEKGGNIVAFLKGESPAIVDTDPGQVAIMKANLDGFVKNLSSEELAALALYMSSVE
ncbi:MAG: c-type cytochrome [Lutibacter sp.]|nr:c-type cytochrome [Lutibacter sp.]